MPLLEFLEEIYPTDEDCQDEFYFGQGDVEFHAKYKSISEELLAARIEDAIKIGMLKITDPEYIPSFKPRGYIYNPEVGNVLVDLDFEIQHEGSDKFRVRGDEVFTGRVFEGELNNPSVDDLKGALKGVWRQTLGNIIEVMDYIDGNVNPRNWEIRLAPIMQRMMREGIITKDKFLNAVERGMQLGVFTRTLKSNVNLYAYNASLKPLLVEILNGTSG